MIFPKVASSLYVFLCIWISCTLAEAFNKPFLNCSMDKVFHENSLKINPLGFKSVWIEPCFKMTSVLDSKVNNLKNLIFVLRRNICKNFVKPYQV